MALSNLSTKIYSAIASFMNHRFNGDIQIYNEISLQLELGHYLRTILTDFHVRFERNIDYYQDNVSQKGFTKREIDIVLFKGDNEKKANEKYAIELKFPRNGQHPEQMFEFIKDIKFMEEVKDKLGFTETFCLTIVDDKNFYLPNPRGTNNKIYEYFRIGDNGEKFIDQGEEIHKPTGNNKQLTIKLNHPHPIKWHQLGDFCDWIDDRKSKEEYRYYLIRI